MRDSTSQGSFADMASQLVSFTSAQERAANLRSYPPHFPQTSLPFDKHVTTYHWQQNNHLLPIHHASDGRGFPEKSCTRQTMYMPGNTSVLLPLSKADASTDATEAISPGNGPVVGSTDLRSAPSISTGPCQLTIFYNGSVCVYDHVSPEKAQAIMLLAGNGDPTKLNTSPSSTPKFQLPKNPCISSSSSPKFQLPVSKVPLDDVAIVTECRVSRLSTVDTTMKNKPPTVSLLMNDTYTANQGAAQQSQSNDIANVNEQPSTRFTVKDSSISNQISRFSGSKPLSASFTQSHVVASTSESEVISVPSVQANCPVPLKVDSIIRAGDVKSAVSAVPQARKASLARFLEKRKERVIDVSPYPVSKTYESNAIGVESTLAATTNFIISKKQFDIVESRT